MKSKNIVLIYVLYFIAIGITDLHAEEKIPAPDFTLMSLEGNKVNLKDLKGKYVFLNFWATWCGPCIEEMPSMEKLYQKLKIKKNFVMLAVSIDKGSQELVKRFVIENKLTFTILLDKDNEVAAEYGIRGIPLTYLIDTKGFLISKAVGAREWGSKESIEYFEKLSGENEDTKKEASGKRQDAKGKR